MSTDDQVATPLPSDVVDAGPGAEEEPRRGRGPAVAVFVALLVVSIGVVGFALAPRGTSSSTQVGDASLPADPTGISAPVFTAASNDGNGQISLSDYAGKPVVVNFWASWCTTCVDEAAVLAAAEKRWKDKGVVFLGVDVQDTPEGARAFEQKYGISYRSVADTDARLQARYRVTGLPETFFISADGTVVSKYISAIDATTLDAMIAKTVQASAT